MRNSSSRRAGRGTTRFGAWGLALITVALCVGCEDDATTLLHVPASEGRPAALLSGTPIKVGSCVRLATADRPQGWALAFADDLGVFTTESELLVDGRPVSSFDGSAGELKLGGGEMTDQQVQDEVSGPTDLDCNAGPTWRVVSIEP